MTLKIRSLCTFSVVTCQNNHCASTNSCVIAEDFLSAWGIPNFFFHVVTAYNILRHKGVDLGKAKYLNAAGKVNMKVTKSEQA